MANELNYFGYIVETGLTVTAKVYDSSWTQVGSDISCTEAWSLSIYIGDMPSSPLGQYWVRFFDWANLLWQGDINWDWSKESELNIDALISNIETKIEADARQTDLKGASNRDITEVYDQALSGTLDQAKFDTLMLAVPTLTKDWYKASSVSIDYKLVWDELTTQTFPANSFGQIIKTNLDETISSRASQTTLDIVDGVVDQILVDTTALKVDTAQIQTDIANQNDISSADVKTQADQALIDYDGATQADLDAAQTSIEGKIDDTKAVTDLIERILLAEAVIDESAFTLTLSDTSGTMKVWNLKDSAGSPSVTEIFERLN